MVKLSPSRVKTLFSCGLLYWNTYKNNELPRSPGNSGSSRGSTVHYVLECLIRPDRKDRVQKILNIRDPWSDVAVKRLAMIHAKKLDVADTENFEMIRKFILTGLQSDFYCNGATEVIAEQQFDIKTDTYHIGGFIDKIAIYKDKIRGVDYKSSKTKFTGKDVTFNLQNYFYTLALREKYPNKPTEFQFQFLKFPKNPIQESPSISNEEMKGFKDWLGEITKFIDNFTYGQAKDMAAKNSPINKWLCGAAHGEVKVDGTPKWTCSMRYPFIYFVIVENGKVVKSEMNRADLEKIVKDGQQIEQRSYNGCEMWKKEWETKN